MIENIWRTIDQRRKEANKRRTWNMRKQDQQIKNAKKIRKKWKYQAPVISMSNKLNQIIDDYTDDREKSDIK